MKANRFDLLKAIHGIGESVKITSKKVVCCDENTIIETNIETDGSEDESYIIDKKLLVNILNKSNGSDITISKNHIGAFNVSTEGAIDIPEIDTDKGIVVGGVNYNDLYSVSFCASKNPANTVLGGVNLKSSDDNVVAVATDGSRLCQRTFEGMSRDATFNVILPILNIKIDDIVLLHISDRAVVFDCGDCKILTRLIAGTYPAVDKILEANRTSIVNENTKELTEALDRMMIINNQSVCLVTTDDGKLELSANSNLGNVKEALSRTSTGKIVARFNPQHLKDAIAGTKEACIYFAEGLKPFEVYDGDTRHIITVQR